MRESAHVKGRRLLTEGRVIVRHAGERNVVAHVRGDSAEIYVVASDARGWSCSCPAQGRCSHQVAVQLVTLTPRAQP